MGLQRVDRAPRVFVMQAASLQPPPFRLDAPTQFRLAELTADDAPDTIKLLNPLFGKALPKHLQG